MADILSALVGNSLVAAIIIVVLPGYFLCTAIASIFLTSRLIIRLAELFITIIFAPILFIFFQLPGIFFGVILLILGFIGASGRFPEFYKEKIFGIDPAIMNYANFILAAFIIMVPLVLLGILLGLFFLFIAILVLAIVGAIFAPELIPVIAPELAGGAGVSGATSASRAVAAPQAAQGAVALNQIAVQGAQTAAVQQAAVPKAATAAAPEAAGETDAAAAMRTAQAETLEEKSALDAMQEAQEGQIEQKQEAADEKGAEKKAKLESAQEELKTATPEQKKEKEEKVKTAQKEYSLTQEDAKRLAEFARSVSTAGSSAGKPGSKLWHVHSALCIISAILAILILFAFAFAPATSSVGAWRDGIMPQLSSFFQGIFAAIAETIINLIDQVVSAFNPCEIGDTGVMCKLLKFRSCEPFCISATGAAPWHGFEISRLEVIPATIYDYQKFSILAEFTNNGEGVTKFRSEQQAPTFSYYVTGGKISCAWGLDKLGTVGIIIGSALGEAKCEKIFPIDKNSKIAQLASGKCVDKGGTLKETCTLEPKESVQVRWLGWKILPNAIPEGATVTPDISINLQYTFVVPNDLVGTVAVQSFNEQVTASTQLKKESQIVNKINKAYSPPGPLMMAMGNAERQVVSTVPTIFLIQFANKGKGVVGGVSGENVAIYLPPEKDFKPTDEENLCDFKKVGAVSDKGVASTGAEWNPGPGYENYIIYQPKHDLPEIGPTRNVQQTPTLYCVLSTPTVSKIQTYDFKMRVLEYQYTESKKAAISIVGTKLTSEGGAEGEESGPSPFEVTHSPQNPKTGEVVTITATARGDAKLHEIAIFLFRKDGTLVKAEYCSMAQAKTGKCDLTKTFSSTGDYAYYAKVYDINNNVKRDPPEGKKTFTVSSP